MSTGAIGLENSHKYKYNCPSSISIKFSRNIFFRQPILRTLHSVPLASDECIIQYRMDDNHKRPATLYILKKNKTRRDVDAMTMKPSACCAMISNDSWSSPAVWLLFDVFDWQSKPQTPRIPKSKLKTAGQLYLGSYRWYTFNERCLPYRTHRNTLLWPLAVRLSW